MLNDPKIITMIVSIVTTLVTLALTLPIKNYFEKKFHIFKLESEHRYEERRKVKQVLSKNKVHLINACESLNHRFYNFNNNHKMKWHHVDGVFDKRSKYYFNSFVWRLANVYAWIGKTENDLILMDTTIASKNDLDFVKFLQLFKHVLCDTSLLFSQYSDYDTSKETDHFFTGTINTIGVALIKKDNSTILFDEYVSALKPLSSKLEPLCKFVDSIEPDDTRHRWDRLRMLHLSIICFLNVYGYDFQKTEMKKIKQSFPLPITEGFLDNYVGLLKRSKLYENKEVKKTIETVRKYM